MKLTTCIALLLFCIPLHPTERTYELPRSHAELNVRAQVECLDPNGCTSAHHCLTPDGWLEAEVDTVDYEDDMGSVLRGAMLRSPWIADGTVACSLHVEGDHNATAVLEHRRSGEEEDSWVYLSRESTRLNRAGSTVRFVRVLSGPSVLGKALAATGHPTPRDWLEEQCDHIRKDTPEYDSCLTHQAGTLYQLAYYVGDEYTDCVVDGLTDYYNDLIEQGREEAISLYWYAWDLEHATRHGRTPYKAEWTDHCAERRPDPEDLR